MARVSADKKQVHFYDLKKRHVHNNKAKGMIQSRIKVSFKFKFPFPISRRVFVYLSKNHTFTRLCMSLQRLGVGR